MNANLHTITLLSGSSATGSSQVSALSGRYCFAVAGTFGGATVGLQMLGPDGATWINIEDDSGALAISSERAVAVLLPAGSFRASVTGGTGVSLYATLNRMVD